MTSATRQLWALHLVMNAVWGGLVYWWLTIPDRNNGQLALTVVSGLLLLGGALWLQSATFRFFGEDAALTVAAAFRRALPRLPLLALWAALLGAALWGVDRVPKLPGAGRWVLGWLLVPALLLPLAPFLATGRNSLLRTWRQPRYWLWALLLLLVGVYLPYRLFWWVPPVRGWTLQAASFGLRALVAYLLLVTSWLMLAKVSAGGTPRWTQR